MTTIRKNIRQESKEVCDRYTVCDWCKKEKREYGNWNKNTSMYNVEEFELTHRIGECYPECDATKTFDIDLCTSCYKKLFSWLREQGITTPYVDNEDRFNDNPTTFTDKEVFEEN